MIEKWKPVETEKRGRPQKRQYRGTCWCSLEKDNTKIRTLEKFKAIPGNHAMSFGKNLPREKAKVLNALIFKFKILPRILPTMENQSLRFFLTFFEELQT